MRFSRLVVVLMNGRKNRGRACVSRSGVITRSLAATLAVLIATLLLTIPLSPALGAGNDLRANVASPGASAGDGTHRLGFKQASPDAAARFSGAGRPKAGAGLQPGASADLTAQLPPVGNQGNESSCVAWATSYYYKSSMEKREHTTWNLSSARNQFSPSFVYNQIDGGNDCGSTFPDAFDVLQNRGDIDIDEMPYDDGDYTLQPTAAQFEAAKPYRIPPDWHYLWLKSGLGPFSSPNDVASAKAWLSDGKPLVMGIPIYSDFPDFGSNPSRPYYDYNGRAGFVGGHGVCIVGYDDNANPQGADADHRGGFKMVNSWGPSWNGPSHGFVWLSYDFVKRYVWEAWTMGDLTDDGPSISGLSASSGDVGSTVCVTGNNFGTKRRDARVTFNGTEATHAVFTNDRVTATVPYGATSGPVVVYDWGGTAGKTAGGASNVNAFTVNNAGCFSYFFAEGSTREGFDEWLSLQNPLPSPLEVTATYMLGGAQPPVTRTYSLEPLSRLSVNVNQEVGPGQDVSVRLLADGEFYAERPMYFNYKKGQAGYSWTGGHVAAGVVTPARDWYFAEGTTRPGFEEWICLQNPNSEEVVANINYTTMGAPASRKDYRLPPQSRVSVFVNGDVGPGLDVSTKVHCDSPIVAERPMYFDYGGKWDGGHDVMGTTSPETKWYFAEGSTRPGFEEWLAVQNLNDQDTRITCHFLKSDGAREDRSYTVSANSRWTLDVSKAVGVGVDSSIVLESKLPVVAERPIYFCYKEGTPGYSWTGGHDVMGSPQAKPAWFFAEGCTYDWADEYICVANPGADSAHVVMTFMLEKGGSVERALSIAPCSRVTVKVADVVGRGHDVSTRIISDKPVIAERPMYFNYNGWTGGHTGAGF
jgi:IPT/TIG domain